MMPASPRAATDVILGRVELGRDLDGDEKGPPFFGHRHCVGDAEREGRPLILVIVVVRKRAALVAIKTLLLSTLLMPPPCVPAVVQ